MKTGGVWMLEEATGLLREIPARSWAIWLAGTLPFTWLFIDFLMEMMHSAYSAERIVNRCLLLTLLFVVKHVAQGVFSRNCLQVLRGDMPDLPSASAVVRLALVQAAWQPLRWPLLTIASVAVIPFPWVVTFLQQIGLAALERERGFAGESWRLGRAGTRADSVALLILTLCWLLLFANLLILWVIVPMLLKSFFGWENDVARLANRMINTTTVMVTVILTFSAMEPLAAAQAAVRSFYAQARHGGEDLRGALRRMAAGVVAAVFLLCGVMPAAGQQKPIDKTVLDRQIDEVLREPEFSWKMPKEGGEQGESLWLRSFFETISRWAQWFYDLYKKLFPDEPPNVEGPNSKWSVNAQLLRWAMIGAAVLAAACVVLILLSRRKDSKKKAEAAAVAVPAIDLQDEGVSAEQLVEDEWLRMAEQYASSGDFRLAMRAVHLAGLRYLGEKGLVTLQPAKTGAEYGRELARRVRDVPAVLDGYGNGLRQYEGVWYGFGVAQADSYHSLRLTWEEMRRNA